MKYIVASNPTTGGVVNARYKEIEGAFRLAVKYALVEAKRTGKRVKINYRDGRLASYVEPEGRVWQPA